MTSSLFRRRLGIRAGYEMLRHRQLRMDRLNVSVSVQADDGGMYIHVLLTGYILYYWQGIYCTCTSMSILALCMDVLWLGRAYIHLHCIVLYKDNMYMQYIICFVLSNVIKSDNRCKLGYTDICFHIFSRGLCCHGYLRSLLKDEQIDFWQLFLSFTSCVYF